MPTEPTTLGDALVVAGIDVGGARKGYHAVALREGQFLACLATRDAAALVDWCRALAVVHVGVDAPCRWSSDGRKRASERALAAAGMACFASPTRDVALAHEAAAVRAGKSGWYGWMFEGERLYAALTREYALYPGGVPAARCCFETFPQAVACALAGEIVSAKEKQRVRRALLADAGVAQEALISIDLVDAALCALAAQAFAAGRWRGYGDDEDGRVIVPDGPLKGNARDWRLPGISL